MFFDVATARSGEPIAKYRRASTAPTFIKRKPSSLHVARTSLSIERHRLNSRRPQSAAARFRRACGITKASRYFFASSSSSRAAVSASRYLPDNTRVAAYELSADEPTIGSRDVGTRGATTRISSMASRISPWRVASISWPLVVLRTPSAEVSCGEVSSRNASDAFCSSSSVTSERNRPQTAFRASWAERASSSARW